MINTNIQFLYVSKMSIFENTNYQNYKVYKIFTIRKTIFPCGENLFFSCGWASRLRQKVCENNDFPMRVYTSSACQNKKSWNIINFQKLKPQPLPRSPPLLCRRRPSEAKLAAPPPDPRARGAEWRLDQRGREAADSPSSDFLSYYTHSVLAFYNNWYYWLYHFYFDHNLLLIIILW